MENFLRFAFILTFTAFLAHNQTFGQCEPLTKRIYADRQETYVTGVLGVIAPGIVSNAPNAIDQTLTTYSTLSVPLGALNLSQARQYLKFPNAVPANKAVTVKLKLNASLLGVLQNATIQPFKDLQQILGSWTATAVGTPTSLTSLVNAVNADGEVEIRLKPNATYHGIWINLGSVLSLASSLGVYEAYILETDTSPSLNCNLAIDVLSGVKSSSLGGIVTALNGVTDPRNAIDGNLNTATTLNVNVSLASDVYETVIFNQLSQPGDSTEIILQNPNDNGLLSLSLLTGFSIQAYNGTDAVGPAINSSSTALSLSLLSGTGSGSKYSLKVGISEPYDRIEIKMSGVAGVLSQTKIYEVRRRMATPKPIVNESAASTAVCSGTTAVLSLSNPQDCTTYRWYADAAGTTLLHQGTSFTTSTLSATTTFYVEAARSNGCTDVSGKIPVTVTVNPAPAVAINSPEACIENSSVKFIISNIQNNASTYQITWSQAALDEGFANVSTDTNIPANGEISVAIPVNTSPAVYTGSITVKNTLGCVSTPKSIQLKVNPAPAPPPITINSSASY